ncbi:hypothetical protein THAOC_28163, partial [Thalassiosira oceanica]
IKTLENLEIFEFWAETRLNYDNRIPFQFASVELNDSTREIVDSVKGFLNRHKNVRVAPGRHLMEPSGREASARKTAASKASAGRSPMDEYTSETKCNRECGRDPSDRCTVCAERTTSTRGDAHTQLQVHGGPAGLAAAEPVQEPAEDDLGGGVLGSTACFPR